MEFLLGQIPEVINDRIANVPCIGNIVFVQLLLERPHISDPAQLFIFYERIRGHHYHCQARGTRRPFHDYRCTGHCGRKRRHASLLGICRIHCSARAILET